MVPMSILFTNVTAVTMDPAAPRLEKGFVAVEGDEDRLCGTSAARRGL